jgi:predicted transcriptional regulator
VIIIYCDTIRVRLSKTTQETIIPCTVEDDLDQLLQSKLDLEKQLRDLEEQQTQLTHQAKTLCEKITQEIKKRNNEKKQAINQLREQYAQMENTVGLEDPIEETTVTPAEILSYPTPKPEIHAVEFSKREETSTPLDVFPV